MRDQGLWFRVEGLGVGQTCFPFFFSPSTASFRAFFDTLSTDATPFSFRFPSPPPPSTAPPFAPSPFFPPFPTAFAAAGCCPPAETRIHAFSYVQTGRAQIYLHTCGTCSVHTCGRACTIIAQAAGRDLCVLQPTLRQKCARLVNKGRGLSPVIRLRVCWLTRAEDAQQTPSQSHIPPSVLVYEEKRLYNACTGCITTCALNVYPVPDRPNLLMVQGYLARKKPPTL